MLKVNMGPLPTDSAGRFFVLPGIDVPLFTVLSRDPDAEIIVGALKLDVVTALLLIEVGVCHLNNTTIPSDSEVFGGVPSREVCCK